MKLTLTIPRVLVAMGMASLLSAQAQVISSTWTLGGGGLDPNTYGDYRPAALTPDTNSTSGGSIALSGLTSGGLGSAAFPDGYGGIYTFFSSNPTYTLSTTNILLDINLITISFWAGGGNPSSIDYTATTLLLNYNGGSQALASTDFDDSVSRLTNTPIGDTALVRYVWTWRDVTNLGALTDFSVQWDTQSLHHVFITDISLIQAVPEPSTLAFLLTGATLLMMRRKRN